MDYSFNFSGAITGCRGLGAADTPAQVELPPRVLAIVQDFSRKRYTSDPVPQAAERCLLRSAVFRALGTSCRDLSPAYYDDVLKALKAVSGDLEHSVYVAFQDKLRLMKDAARYGHKAANLIVLNELLPKQVPEFYCMASEDVRPSLEDSPKFTMSWKAFQAGHSGEELSAESRDQLSSVAEACQQVCENSLVLGRGVTDFVAQVAALKGLLMVRSSGSDEDSDVEMLSGANTSCVAVAPVVSDLSTAIGETTGSYFLTGIERRVMHGLDVRADYFVPCLLQRMVGEQRPGDPISVSGVMFTQEPLGPTPSTPIITASYGDGDGVVQGQVACDRILIMDDGRFIKTIRRKEYRIGPLEGGGRGPVANPTALQGRCCLSDAQILELRRIAVRLEAFYGQAMDVEFIVEAEQVWIVQARPVTRKPGSSASYLVDDDSAGSKRYVGETLAAGSGAAIITNDLSELIFASTVNAAFASFMRLDAQARRRVSALVVAQGGENLSHFISLFQSKSIPVLAIEGAPKLRESTSLIVICPQRGILQVGGQPELRGGRHSHPASGVHSLEAPQAGRVEGLDVFLRQLAGKFHDDEETGNLADALRSRDPAVLSRAIGRLLFRFQRFINGPLSSSGKRLQRDVEIAAKQILCAGVAAHRYAREGREMEQLLTVNLIEARLYTQAESQAVIDGDGFDAMAGDCKLERLARRDLGELCEHERYGEHVIELHKVGRYALQPQVAQGWVQLLREVYSSRSDSACQSLIRLVHWLAERDLLDLYLNSVFPRLLTEHQDSHALLIAMGHSVSGDAKTVGWCQESLRKLKSLQLANSGFAEKDPVAFEKAFQRLEHLALIPLIDEFAASRFEDSGPMGRLMLLEVYRRCMDVCDGALKALVDSPELAALEESEREMRFRKIFDPFFEFQFKLVELLDETSIHALTKDRHLSGSVSPQAFLELVRQARIKRETTKEFYKSDLLASPNFAVNVNMLGSASVLLPFHMTLVDLWTLSHQNLITLCAVLTRQSSPVLPQVLGSPIGTLVHELSSLPIPDNEGLASAALVHCKLSYPWLEASFNIPLNHHSAVVDLRFNRRTQEAELKFKGYGHHMNLRWTSVMLLASIAVESCEELKFARGAEPKIDAPRDVHSCAWCFRVPGTEAGRQQLTRQLGGLLKRMCFIAYPSRSDPRMRGEVLGQHFNELSVFELAVDFAQISGHPLSKEQLLRTIPPETLHKFLEEVTTHRHFPRSSDLLGLLRLDTLKQLIADREHVAPDLLALALAKLLLSKDTGEETRRLLRSSTSEDTLQTLLLAADSVCSERSRRDFHLLAVPAFCIVHAGLAKHWVSETEGFLSKSEDLRVYENGGYLAISANLCLWPSKARRLLLKALNSKTLACLVHYGCHPEWRQELVDVCVEKNCVADLAVQLLRLADGCFEGVQEYMLPIEERQASLDSCLQQLPELAARSSTADRLRCVNKLRKGLKTQKVSQELLVRLVRTLSESEVHSWLKSQHYDSWRQKFFSKTLPLLAQADVLWLQSFRKRLLSVIEPCSSKRSEFQHGVPFAVAALIADLLAQMPKEEQERYFRYMVEDARADSGCPTKGMTYLTVLYACRSELTRQAMVAFLKEQDRWELLSWGGWINDDDRSQDELTDSYYAARQLLQNQFDEERLRDIFANPEHRDWGVSLMGPLLLSKFSELALNRIFAKGAKSFHSYFWGTAMTRLFPLEKMRILMTQLVRRSRGCEQSYLKHLSAWDIFRLLKWSYELKDDDLHKQLIAFLKHVPKERIPECARELKGSAGIHYEVRPRYAQELGWPLPED